jgi:hypothetical protein
VVCCSICISIFEGRVGRGCLHRMEEPNDERQLFVPLGNRIQGKADGSVIAVEPILFQQICAGGLLLACELGLYL